MGDTFTDRDLRDEVTQSLADDALGFDIQAIVDEIQATYGTRSIETLSHDEYWDIVVKHERVGDQLHDAAEDTIRKTLG